MKRIYFDYAATTPMDIEVKKAMEPYFCEQFGNPSSLHSFGQKTMAAIDESREKIAKAIGADFREIIFTGSATEANNLAIRGILNFLNQGHIVLKNVPQARQLGFSQSENGAPRGKKILPLEQNYSGSERQLPENLKNLLPLRIIVSAIEHESILETCRDLEKEGIEIIYLPVDKNGIVNLKKLKESLNKRTILVSIMYANNEIGTIQPIIEIAKIIQEFRIKNLELNKKNPQSSILNPQSYPLLHTDAVQAFQFLDCNVNDLGVDLMTLSAHKIYGPKGIGALYRRIKNKGLRIKDFNNNPLNSQFSILNPIITGGGQEFGLRSGTENVPVIVGFAKAIELTEKNREKEFKRIAELSAYFWKELKKIEPKIQLNNNLNQNQFVLKNVPQARQLGFSQNENGAPRGKKILPLEQNYSGSERQIVFDYLPNILNIYFPNQNAQDLLMKLDLNGIAVSSGSACSTRAIKISHVLKAIGLPEKRIKSSLRFSFGKFTTKKEINEMIKRMKKIL